MARHWPAQRSVGHRLSRLLRKAAHFHPDTVARCVVLRAATRTPACPTVHRALRHAASPHHLVAGKTGTGLRASPTAPCCGGADGAIAAATPQDRQALSAW